MGPVLQGITFLLVILSFVAAWFSAKTWRVYTIVLVMFIFIASLGFFYLAARTLKTHKSWKEIAIQREKELDELEKKNLELAEGVEQAGKDALAGIRQLKKELHFAAIERGGIWLDVAPEKINATTGAVVVGVESPEPHGLKEKRVLFLFTQDNVAEDGRYLGEFQVTKADKESKSVSLEPNLPLEPEQLKALGGMIETVAGDHEPPEANVMREHTGTAASVVRRHTDGL